MQLWGRESVNNAVSGNIRGLVKKGGAVKRERESHLFVCSLNLNLAFIRTLSFSVSSLNPPPTPYTNHHGMAEPRFAAFKARCDATIFRIIGRTCVWLRLRRGVPVRWRSAFGGGAEARFGEVREGEGSAVGGDGRAGSLEARLRREALKPSWSCSHFHGIARPSRAQPYIFSLQAGIFIYKEVT